MLKLVLLPLGGYALLLLMLYTGQRNLLYLPGNRELSDAQAASLGWRKWPEEEGYLGYLWTPSSSPDDAARAGDEAASSAAGEPDGTNGPTSATTVGAGDATASIVVFHGNAGDALDRFHYRDALAFTGARVLVAEYPGYGGRRGPTTETTMTTAARELLARVRRAWPDERVYVVGESLGSGVAAAALADPRTAADVDALLLITPWDSLVEVARAHYWYVPVRRLLRDRYPSERNLSGYAAPKAVVIAAEDRTVPAARAEALFAALPEPKRRFVVDGAGHNTWFRTVDPSWWRDVWRFLSTAGDTAESR